MKRLFMEFSQISGSFVPLILKYSLELPFKRLQCTYYLTFVWMTNETQEKLEPCVFISAAKHLTNVIFFKVTVIEILSLPTRHLPLSLIRCAQTDLWRAYQETKALLPTFLHSPVDPGHILRFNSNNSHLFVHWKGRMCLVGKLRLSKQHINNPPWYKLDFALFFFFLNLQTQRVGWLKG
jgi:hypothetical protein